MIDFTFVNVYGIDKATYHIDFPSANIFYYGVLFRLNLIAGYICITLFIYPNV
jgi:hypothetical protein